MARQKRETYGIARNGVRGLAARRIVMASDAFFLCHFITVTVNTCGYVRPVAQADGQDRIAKFPTAVIKKASVAGLSLLSQGSFKIESAE